uniref:OstA-like protein n=1 Tax=Alistipes sp. TaxID=1872444 RepID=UPI0040561CA2
MRRKIIAPVIVLSLFIGVLFYAASGREYDHAVDYKSVLQTPQTSTASNRRMVDMIADDSYLIEKGDSTIFILVGNFAAHHNGTVILADSAVRYSNQSFECFGNVLINQNETYAYGERAEYNRDKSTATIYSELIKVVDGEAVMYTYNCTFNSAKNEGRFYGGCYVEKGESLLEADHGYYNTETHDLIAVDNVEMRDETYLMTGDSVIFNTQTEDARYFTNTNIWNDKDEYLFANEGTYTKARDLHHLTRDAYILSPEREIWSDTIEYFRTEGHIIGRRNIQMDDTTQKVIGFADYGEWWDEPGNAFFTRRPSMINYDPEQPDSLFLAADTLWMYTIPVLPPSAEGADSLATDASAPAASGERNAEERAMSEVIGTDDEATAEEAAEETTIDTEDEETADEAEEVADDPRADAIKGGDVAPDRAAVKGGDQAAPEQPATAKPEAGAGDPTTPPAKPDKPQRPETPVRGNEGNAEVAIGSAGASTLEGEHPELGAPRGEADSIRTQAGDTPLAMATPEAERRVGDHSVKAPDSLRVDSLAMERLTTDSLATDSIAADTVKVLTAKQLRYRAKLEKRRIRDSIRGVERAIRDSINAIKQAEQDSIRHIRDSVLRIKLDTIIAKRIAQSSRLADEEAARLERVKQKAEERNRRKIDKAKARALKRGKIYTGEDYTIDSLAANSLATDTLDGARNERDTMGRDTTAIDSLSTDSLALDSIVEKPFPSDSVYKMIKAYRNVRMYRSDTQMVGDSLVLLNTDSIIRLYIDPIMWQENNQITSDSMAIHTRNELIDKAHFMGDPIMGMEIDTMYYNQVKGKDMIAYFADGSVYRNDVEGNAQTIYFMQEEDSPEVTGLMYIESASISFYLIEGNIDKITYKQNPEYVLYPMDMIPETQERRLPDFKWHYDRRPQRDSVHDRTIRPTRREDATSRQKPRFRITERINYDRRRLVENRMWVDRLDQLTPEIIEWRNSRPSYQEKR